MRKWMSRPRLVQKRLKNLRKREGLTRWQLAQALGYEGKRASLETQIKRWEGGHRPVPPWIIRLLMYMDAYAIPKDWYDDEIS